MKLMMSRERMYKLSVPNADAFCKVVHYYCQISPVDKESSIDSLSLTTETIPYSRLTQEADTFDLLLFKNKTFMSKVQRFVTNSTYDHVGMILRSSQN